MAGYVGRHAAPGTDRSASLLTGLVLLLAVVVPGAALVVLTTQVVRTGNVSHWPWEEHGVHGWWLVPASLWLAAACAAARPPDGAGTVSVRLLAVLAAGTSVALLYNP